MLQPRTRDLQGAEQGAQRAAAMGLEPEGCTAVRARRMCVEKGVNLLLQDVGVAVQFVLKPTISMTKKINELGLYKRTFSNKINPFLRFWSFPCLLLP